MIQVRSLQKKLIRCSSAKIFSDLYILLNNLGPRLVKELLVTHVRALCKYELSRWDLILYVAEPDARFRYLLPVRKCLL